VQIHMLEDVHVSVLLIWWQMRWNNDELHAAGHSRLCFEAERFWQVTVFAQSG
jgi:hypothetical protein